jgi:hypothetical protein
MDNIIQATSTLQYIIIRPTYMPSIAMNRKRIEIWAEYEQEIRPR